MSLPETIYTLDVLFCAFVLLFGVAGMLRGLPGELARLLTLAGLLAGVCFFYPALTRLAAQQWPMLPPAAIHAVTVAALLLCAMVFYLLLRLLLRSLLKDRGGVFLDRVSGAIVGMVFGVLMGLCVLCSISLLPQDRPYQILSEKSMIGNWVCTTLTPWIYPRLMEMPIFDAEAGAREQESGDL